MTGAALWNYRMSDNKKNQLLVLQTLQDLINEAAANDDEKRAISVAAVVVYSDGSTSSNISGFLDRPVMTGLLVDLSNQVFFECKQRELSDAAEDAMQKLHLAQSPPTEKAN